MNIFKTLQKKLGLLAYNQLGQFVDEKMSESDNKVIETLVVENYGDTFTLPKSELIEINIDGIHSGYSINPIICCISNIKEEQSVAIKFFAINASHILYYGTVEVNYIDNSIEILVSDLDPVKVVQSNINP